MQRFQDAQTLTQKTSIRPTMQTSWGLDLTASARQLYGRRLSQHLDILETLFWGRLKDVSPRRLILGVMDVFWNNVLDILKTCLDDVIGTGVYPQGYLSMSASFHRIQPRRQPPMCLAHWTGTKASRQFRKTDINLKTCHLDLYRQGHVSLFYSSIMI